jgi:hypothetical protein
MEKHTVMCTYRVKQDKEDEFALHLRKHWQTLHSFGLVTGEPSLMFRGLDDSGKSFFVEIFHWKSVDGHKVAEQTPDILAIWERMGALVERRSGRPAMEFPFVRQLEWA